MLKQRLDACMEEHPFYNLNEAIYAVLCRSIIDLSLAPGEVLSETALAKDLSVSRSPVRDALLRLQSDGLVTQSKGQSFQVASIDKAECRELMEARLAIEGQAAFWAAERAGAQNLAAMENLWLACEEQGLGGVWMGIAPQPERMQAVEQLVCIPEGLRAFAVFPLGYPAEERQQQNRFDESRIHYIK